MPLPAIAEVLTADEGTVARVQRGERDRLEGELSRRPLREAYLADPATTGPAQLVTRLLVPIDVQEETG